MKKLIALGTLFLCSFFFSGCQAILEHRSKSGLQVITDDVPSAVYLDGQYLNSTPLIEKELKPGSYSLKIEPNDISLQPYETSITLRKGLLTVVTWKPAERPEMSGGVIYEMEKLDNSSASEISFTTIPDEAIITLEGREKEFSPFVFTNIPPGNKSFEVTLPSYETQNHTINVQPGYKMLVRIQLAKLQAVGQTEPSTSPEPIPAATTSAIPEPSVVPTSQPTETLLSSRSAELTR